MSISRASLIISLHTTMQQALAIGDFSTEELTRLKSFSTGIMSVTAHITKRISHILAQATGQ